MALGEGLPCKMFAVPLALLGATMATNGKDPGAKTPKNSNNPHLGENTKRYYPREPRNMG